MRTIILAVTLLILMTLQLYSERDTLWTKVMPGEITQVVLSPRGSYLAVCTDSTYLLDPRSGQLLQTFSGYGRLFFSKDERFILRYRQGTGIFDKLEISTGVLVKSFAISVGSQQQMALSDDEKHLFVPYYVKNAPFLDARPRLIIYDVENGIEVKQCPIADQPRLLAANLGNIAVFDSTRVLMGVSRFYDDGGGNVLASSSNSIFDFAGCDSLGSMIRGMSFIASLDKRYLVVRNPSTTQGVSVYDCLENRVVTTIPINAFSMSDFAISSDNKYVAITQAGGENELSLWNIKDGRKLFSDKHNSFLRVTTYAPENLVCSFVYEYLFMFKPRELTSISTNNGATFRTLFPNPSNQYVDIPTEPEIEGEVTVDAFDESGEFLGRVFESTLSSGSDHLHVCLSTIQTSKCFLVVNMHQRVETYCVSINR